MFEWFHGLSLLGISGNTVKKKHYLNDRKIFFTKVLQGLSQIGALIFVLKKGIIFLLLHLLYMGVSEFYLSL